MSCTTASVEQDPFVVRIGDTYRFSVAVVGDNCGAPDLTGALLDFGYGVTREAEDRENADRSSAEPDLGTAARNGTTYPALDITLSSAETRELVDGVRYYWAARVTITGVPEVVASGYFDAQSVPL